MAPTLSSLQKYRYNVTKACDSCRQLKIRCKKLTQSNNCDVCIKRHQECTYNAQPAKRGPKFKNNPKKRPTSDIDSSSNEQQDDKSDRDSTLSQDDEPYRDSNLFQEDEPLCGLIFGEMYRGLIFDELYCFDALYRGLNTSPGECKLFEEIFEKEQLEILSSTSSKPCPYENIEGHYCHRGCIVRRNY
ncbi:36858_t:CDS:1 [Gigaspora margarita]|uniref:36858_t:CDS:1 n=1 Tax=Gigaspora margarita TaxID=4874 RepID=A0ABM8W026_GIGMA|nr:36858_t:CDS:1 [Gigaspora margarita]